MADLSPFNIKDATYKEVEGHSIGVSIVTPKDLPAGKHPVILRWHGGFLITGSRLYSDWLQQWVLDLAVQRQAILVVPDYRLLPEANGADIISDVDSLFTWLHDELPLKLSGLGFEADLDCILVCGESAGGYLAVQSALLHPNSGIKAVISAYGVLDIKTRFFTEAFEKPMGGSANVDEKVLNDHLELIKQGKTAKVVTAAEPPERIPITRAIIQHGRYAELIGNATELYPMENLEKRMDGEVPPMWVFHGTEDSVVPVAGSHAFAEKLKRLHPATDLLLTIETGEHTFDKKTKMDEPWLKNGIGFVSQHWP